MVDSKAFVLLLRAQIALEDEDTGRARELWEAARAETARGTPPPQFLAMLNLLDALLSADESGPGPALPKLAGTLCMAVETRCSDLVRATLVDSAAGLLADLGDYPRAARLLAAGDRARGGHPRPMPERAQPERAEAAARAALGAERYAAEHARGTALTADDVAHDLDDASRDRLTGRTAP
ncbi:hypothetical protein H8R17_24505 [Streptomyces sp. TRM68367]|nr:hypothetical protein [Streptomyces sp. TRM68367]